MSTTTTPTAVETAARESASVRKARAAVAFTDTSVDVATCATLFADTPNPREFVDECYVSTVGAAMLAAASAGNVPDPTIGATYGERRNLIVAALPEKSATRTVDPIAARAADVARLANVTALRDALLAATESVEKVLTDLIGEKFADANATTPDEKATVDATRVSDVVSRRIALVVSAANATPQKSDGEPRTRGVVDHPTLTDGTVLTDSKGRSIMVHVAADGATTFTDSAGNSYASISGAAKAVTGQKSIDGWKHFGLKS